VRVVADDRERASGVVEALRVMEGVEVVGERLTLGDNLVDDRPLFERKTAVDFANSLVDGRLFQQACRLVPNPRIRRTETHPRPRNAGRFYSILC